jgi:dynein heavy chain
MSVATIFLENLEFDGMTPEMRQSLYQLCGYVHQTVETLCTSYFNSLKRNVYVTPKSYLDLIDSYKSLLIFKRDELSTNRNKLSSGL